VLLWFGVDPEMLELPETDPLGEPTDPLAEPLEFRSPAPPRAPLRSQLAELELEPGVELDPEIEVLLYVLLL